MYPEESFVCVSTVKDISKAGFRWNVEEGWSLVLSRFDQIDSKMNLNLNSDAVVFTFWFSTVLWIALSAYSLVTSINSLFTSFNKINDQSLRSEFLLTSVYGQRSSDIRWHNDIKSFYRLIYYPQFGWTLPLCPLCVNFKSIISRIFSFPLWSSSHRETMNILLQNYRSPIFIYLTISTYCICSFDILSVNDQFYTLFAFL